MKDRSVGDQGEALGPRTARGYSEGQVWGVMVGGALGPRTARGYSERQVRGVWGEGGGRGSIGSKDCTEVTVKDRSRG